MITIILNCSMSDFFNESASKSVIAIPAVKNAIYATLFFLTYVNDLGPKLKRAAATESKA